MWGPQFVGYAKLCDPELDPANLAKHFDTLLKRQNTYQHYSSLDHLSRAMDWANDLLTKHPMLAQEMAEEHKVLIDFEEFKKHFKMSRDEVPVAMDPPKANAPQKGDDKGDVVGV